MPEAKEELVVDDLAAGVQTAAAVPAKTLDSGKKPSAADRPSRRIRPQIELTLARLREFTREPELIFWTFIFPLLLAFSLGLAFRNTGPEQVYIAVESSAADRGEAARLSDLFSHSPQIRLRTLSPDAAAAALRSGKIALIVRPADPQADPRASDTPDGGVGSSVSPLFRYRFDPTRPDSRLARLVVDDELQRALGRADVASSSDEKVSEHGARYIDFLIPGLLGMSIMGGGFWGVGVGIVVARTRKLLKRFAATPMKRSHYLLSFVFARMTFWVLELTAIIIFARYVFGFTIRGSLIEMVFLLVGGGLAFASIGLLIAARPKTIEGVSGISNLVMMPMWLLSGTFFSSERFPESIQPFIKVLPLTALNSALRAVMNDGTPLAAHWVELLVLAGWGGLSFLIALKIFRWQ